MNYVMFLLDSIENPPSEDYEDQVPDAFLNMVLAFNQHFPDPPTNLVMMALKQRPNPRNFSEKLMYLINRGGESISRVTYVCTYAVMLLLEQGRLRHVNLHVVHSGTCFNVPFSCMFFL